MVSRRVVSLLLLLVLSLIWGSSFILIKKSLIGLSALQTGALRVLISAAAFLPWIIARRQRIPWRHLKYIVLFGLCEVGIPPYLYAIAQTRVESATAGILNSLVPLFTLAVGTLFFSLKAGRNEVAGVGLGLIGAMLLVGGGGFHFQSADLFGLLIVLATLLYAFGGNILQNRLSAVSPVDISAMAFVSMGIPSLAVLGFTGLPEVNPETIPSLLAVTVLSLVGSGAAIVLFSRLIHLSGALTASFVTYLIPVVAVVWAVLDGEILTWLQFAALFGILAGVRLVTHRPRA